MTEVYDVKNSIYISSGRISDHEIPTLISTRSGRIADHEVPTVFIVNTVSSGEHDVPDEVICSNTSGSYTDDIIEFVTYNSQQGSLDTYIESTTASSLSAANNIYDYYNISDTSQLKINVPNELLQTGVSTTFDYILDDLFISGDPVTVLNNVPTILRVAIGTLEAARDTVNTMDLSFVKYFRIDSSIYCTASVDTLNIITDVLQDTGRVTLIENDLFITSLSVPLIGCALTIADVLKHHLISDLELATGRALDIESDIFNTASNVQAMAAEIKTRSLFAAGFFVQEFEFVKADSIGYIDVVDFLYPIVESSIVVTIDGIQQSLINIESMDNIKRVYFNPDNNFYSTGEIVVNIYAESSIGEILDHNFVLLYGYDVVPNEAVPLLPNSTIVIRGEAKNLAFCPNKEAFSYYFTTVDYDSFNLNMSIIPTEPVDLAMSIYPQSTAFFYGRTYTVTVSGIKDFAGNEMEPFEYSFTIENPET